LLTYFISCWILAGQAKIQTVGNHLKTNKMEREKRSIILTTDARKASASRGRKKRMNA
jgi:hypothetical protein